MGAIFISYRRDDVEGQAGRLFDELTGLFGTDSVFMDVAGIEPGRDFRRAIDHQVASCSVLLAIIGKQWLTAKDESGARRLDNPMDFVRLETASALKRDIPVVPVLVQGARMPRGEDLPEDLRELAFRNAVELTHARWDSDVQVLEKALRPYVQVAQTPPSPSPRSTPRAPGTTRVIRLWAGVAVAVVLTGSLIIWKTERNAASSQDSFRSAIAETVSNGLTSRDPGSTAPPHKPVPGVGVYGPAPSAVMAGDRLTVFARTAQGTLTHKFYDPPWTDWIPLGDGQISSAPSAVMAGDRLTVFARTAQGTLTHKFYDPQKQTWTAWIPLGDGQISFAPSAVMAGDRLTVFARTAQGTLTHKFYDPQKQTWTAWIPLGDGQISSAPSAVMAGDRLTVFARTAQGTLTHKSYDPQKQAWTDWIPLGDGQISSAPSAVMAGDRLTVFARTAQGTLTQTFRDPQKQTWTSWIPLGDGQISSAPSAVMAGDRLTVFARTAQGTLTHKFYDPQKQTWTDWIDLGDGQIT